MIQAAKPFPRAVGNQAYQDLIELVDRYERAKSAIGTRPINSMGRVVVAGAFSSGKSSFINHILGGTVAVEGAAPTTRTSTEYVYGKVLSYYRLDGKGKSKEKISKVEYMRDSCKKGGTGQFRVVVPSDFLKKNGVVLVDTPGFDDEKNDNDSAKKSIQEADVLFWVVNINDGTLRDGELKFLKKATKRDVADVPISFFLSQIDTMNPSKGGSVLDSLDVVKKKIVTEAGEAELRFMSAPIFYTSKPDNVVIKSLKPIVKDQEKKLLEIVSECKAALCRKNNAITENAMDKAERIRRSIIEQCEDREEDLKGLIKKTERLEKRRERLLADNLHDEILGLVQACLESAADSMSASSDCIKSYVSESGLIWDTYSAEFEPSKFSLCEKRLSASLASKFKELTDFRGSSINIGAAKNALAKELGERTWSTTDDSWSDSARYYARSKMASQLSRILRNDSKELAEAFYEKMIYPSCHFVDDNMEDLEETIRQTKEACSWIEEIHQIVA